MVTREYKCNTCQHQFEQKQSIKDKILDRCPACEQWTLESVLSGGLQPICNNITTLGQLAAYNTKRMGKYELEDKRHNFKQNEKVAREELRNEAERRLGKKIERVETDTQDAKKLEKINKMTPKQKEKYIQTGTGI